MSREVVLLHVEDHSEVRNLVQQLVYWDTDGIGRYCEVATPDDFAKLLEDFGTTFSDTAVVAVLDGVISDRRTGKSISGESVAVSLRRVASDNNIPLRIMSLSDRPWTFADPGLAFIKGNPIEHLTEAMQKAVDSYKTQ